MSKKMKWLALLLCVLIAGGTIAGLVTAVQAANTDITSRLTYTYVLRDSDNNIVPPSGYNFTNNVYTITINWNLSNTQPVLDTGDYINLPFVFTGGLSLIQMSDYTFNFTGTKPGGGGTGVAGSATLSEVNGNTWNLKATFNSFLKDLNNISGTFQLALQIYFPDDEAPQVWKINDFIVGGGWNPPDSGEYVVPGYYYERTPIAKYGGNDPAPSGIVGLNEWNVNVNSQCMSNADFFARYAGGAYDGTPPAKIRVTDTLGPGQVMYHMFRRLGPTWLTTPAAKDPAHLRYGGPSDTNAYFIAYTVDFRGMWAYFANPANKAWIEDVSGYEVDPSYYAIIPGPNTMLPNGKTMGQEYGLLPGAVPFTPAMSSFMYMSMAAYGTTGGYTTAERNRINTFCDTYLMDISPYMSNLERTGSGFAFDLDVAAIDGRGLFMTYFSQVINPAQLVGGNPPHITNTFGISFGGVQDDVESYSGQWLSGGGNAVGDNNTLTIFKKGDDTGGDLAGAVFTVERLGANPLTTGGAVSGVITLTTTPGGGGIFSATTGDLGSYGPEEIYKIVEVTPPMGYGGHTDPIYLKINPTGYVVTLCDVNGAPVTLPAAIGLCDNTGAVLATGKNLYVTNRNAGTGEEILFTNEYVGVDFVFKKTDRKGNPLEGVEFRLFSCARIHTHDPLVLPNGDSCWGTTFIPATSDAGGIVTYNQLLNGDYMLVESKANPGFQMPLGQWLIHIESGANPEITITAQGDTPPPAFVVDENDGLLTVINYPSFVMPQAGSLGALLAATGGTALMGISLVLLATRKKKRKVYD